MMKFPVAREKYEEAILERNEAIEAMAQLEARSAELLQKVEQLQSTRQTPPADDPTLELNRLQEENSNLRGENTSLNSDLLEANDTIATLRQTIERLNSEAPVPPAIAASQNDSSGDPSLALNDFMVQNHDDTFKCIRRLKEEGF